MKILGGTLRNRNFFMPQGIRPTQDKTRKAIFDILGQEVEGIIFLDLFAGSGAVGLEAVSRKAKQVVFVEKDSRCADVIIENITSLRGNSYGKDSHLFSVIKGDAFVVIKNFSAQDKKFDIVFADPPYGLDLAKKTLKTLMAYDILHPNSFIIIQHEKKEILPDFEGRILRVREKKYGDSRVTVFRSLY